MRRKFGMSTATPSVVAPLQRRRKKPPKDNGLKSNPELNSRSSGTLPALPNLATALHRSRVLPGMNPTVQPPEIRYDRSRRQNLRFGEFALRLGGGSKFQDQFSKSRAEVRPILRTSKHKRMLVG